MQYMQSKLDKYKIQLEQLEVREKIASPHIEAPQVTFSFHISICFFVSIHSCQSQNKLIDSGLMHENIVNDYKVHFR